MPIAQVGMSRKQRPAKARMQRELWKAAGDGDISWPGPNRSSAPLPEGHCSLCLNSFFSSSLDTEIIETRAFPLADAERNGRRGTKRCATCRIIVEVAESRFFHHETKKGKIPLDMIQGRLSRQGPELFWLDLQVMPGNKAYAQEKLVSTEIYFDGSGGSRLQ